LKKKSDNPDGTGDHVVPESLDEIMPPPADGKANKKLPFTSQHIELTLFAAVVKLFN